MKDRLNTIKHRARPPKPAEFASGQRAAGDAEVGYGWLGEWWRPVACMIMEGFLGLLFDTIPNACSRWIDDTHRS